MVKKELEHTGHIRKTMALSIFNQAHFHKEDLVGDKSPYRFIRYRPSKHKNSDMFFNRALRLLERKPTHEIYKLGLFDLMQLDFDTFVMLEEQIEEMDRVHEKTVADFTKEQNKELMKDKNKQ